MAPDDSRADKDDAQRLIRRALEALQGAFTVSPVPTGGDEDQARLALPALVLATEAAAIAVLDERGGIIFANPKARQLLDLNHTTPPGDDRAPDPPSELLAFRLVAITGTPLFDARCEIHTAERGRHVLSVNAAPLPDSGNGPPLVALAMTDLTGQYDYYEHALRESEQRLKLATEAAGLGVWEYDLKTDTYHWDERMMAIYGLDESQRPVTYQDWLALLVPEHQDRLHAASSPGAGRGERREIEFRIRRPDGEQRHIRAVWQGIEDPHGRTQRLVGTNEDITEQRELQSELEYRAAHDPLTDLFNRAKIQQLLRAAQAAFTRHGTPFAVLLFDVDHFKRVNDRYGHGAGDAVLWEMARRIESVLRETDHMGRWGGEEFLVLASQTDEAGAETLAERIRRQVAQTPFEGVGTVTVSLGVAAAEAGTSLETLEQRADRALYAAKHNGRNQSVRYSRLPETADDGPAAPAR
ncbi:MULTISPECIES: sensor domain-containing diguanylate cyclase [unclassified Halorhodospira]|uniref:sensor domain-containing diguanylate cyclase n=1 Tax=unclassified Halorhodospira TaxID=2626748 RepID=UPI001EE78B92|nr:MULTISPECIES: sensor domain-containing diguanylate cyclase [unclassified Halorhodospira]MCG5533998.1 sensor domain-containing diguanylate cyclase [Halorhodospira sp. 9621]MCG5540261.1 sensor domain-containing diguanylate cyclase [Halorhodospira sp. M39old]MCG5545799.1 sensor domain-containing diguanylate cyclase [Halorhodospira sp. M38]